MSILRKYGNPPFNVALVHGGPGALGEMAPVARELAKTHGVLEPLQSALTIEDEIEELWLVLMENAASPCILAGYSWGAWLAFMLAARYPALVSKLILVSSGPFTPDYALDIDRRRFERLNPDEREELVRLKSKIDDPAYEDDKNSLMEHAGRLFSVADSFDVLPHASEAECRWDIFSAIWPQAAAMRKSGALLALASDISCPVVAIHGDYDPHPADGVRIPLSSALKDFRFILLEKCGHTPWLERQAGDRFYEVLNRETGLSDPSTY